MLERSQPVFQTTPLDPALLTAPFTIQTRWYVLTGAACCGKTTLLNLLADRGFAVIQESARQYFEEQLAGGRSLEQIRADGAGLQRGIAALQMEFERSCPPERTTFLDRALPDSLTFYRAFGMDPNAILPACFQYRYAGAFLLERLPVKRDQTLGPEDEASSALLDAWLERDYRALGYAVVRVPPVPPQERLAYILERLAK